MSQTDSGLTPPLPAATVLLLRDSEHGVQVFMVERNRAIKFASGALVFPGGKIDEEDADEKFLARASGLGDLNVADRALRIGAVREVFEETGVLLARRRAGNSILAGAEAAKIAARYRAELLSNNVTLLDILDAEDLQLQTGEMVRFAHWITPRVRKIRYDTHFYLIALPGSQSACHDGDESVSSLWLTAALAAEQMTDGGYSAMAPTLLNLDKLSQSETVESALTTARDATVVTVEPQVREAADGTKRVHIPAGAGYSTSNYPFKTGWVKSK